MKFVEDELVKEVKRHNKNRFNGFIQFLGLRLFGSRLSMKCLHELRYKRGFLPSLKYLEKLDADIVFNTHFSTLYYAVRARKRGLINSKIITYCPDPVVGLQWIGGGDLIALSSGEGARKAVKSGRFCGENVIDTPFLIRKEVELYDKGKAHYRRLLDIPEDRFTILAADGAYGAGRLKKTVYGLLKAKSKITVMAVCGKNESLHKEFLKIAPPDNITFRPYGFTDKTLALAAACDLFMGKAGASNLAEPSYFGAPSIVTFTATPIEKWICRNFVKSGRALKITNINKAVKTALEFANNPALMRKYGQAAKASSRSDGADILADIIWESLSGGRHI
jgi:UDP-N-acetylglucosamine:LPS N-acetylglucosamine transferase